MFSAIRLSVSSVLTAGLLCAALDSPARADLLVGSHNTSSILRYDETTGAFLGAFVPSGSGGLSLPHGLAFGPDRNFYATGHRDGGGGVNDVFRYNGQTGAFLDLFVPAASSGLNFSLDMEFGPDGNLYVNSLRNSQVGRYDGSSGAALGALTGGGLNGPNGMAFGPDGNLYVGNEGDNSIVRFNPTTGQALGTFVAAGAGGLNGPFDMTFGPDGDFYVSSTANASILRFDGSSGSFLGAFVTSGSGGLARASGLAFGPDGNLYVGSLDDDRVLRYNGATGAFIDAFVTQGSGGLDYPHNLVFTPIPEPASLTLLSVGILGLLVYGWRRHRR